MLPSTVSQTREGFAGAHEQAELIGWIELNQDNSAIEDKAIPCKADNRMPSGGTGNKRRSLVTVASTARTNKVMSRAAWLPRVSHLSIRAAVMRENRRAAPQHGCGRSFFGEVRGSGSVCRRRRQTKGLSLSLLAEKWNNIVAGRPPGSARGQTAQGGCEFMKTEEDVAVMAGL